MVTFKEKKWLMGIAGVSVFATVTMILSVPPRDSIVVGAFIFLASLSVGLCSRIFFSSKTSWIMMIFMFSFLSLSLLIGYNTLNTILLISLLTLMRFLIE